MKIFGYDLTKLFGWISDAYAVTKALEALDKKHSSEKNEKGVENGSYSE